VRIDAAMDIAAEVVATEARKNIQRSPRGGRTYEKYNPRRTHKASAAGEAPATDTGNLARSITTVVNYQNKTFTLRASSQLAPYARALEYGDMSRNLAPRPFMRPALVAKRDKALEIMANAVSKALRDIQT
jgi:hypothetical protein